MKNNRIQLDPETWLYEPDRRDDFRVDPDQLEPIIFTVGGQLLSVFNLSAGGLACEVGHLLEGQRYEGRVNLPMPTQLSVMFDIVVDVVLISGEIARCRFVDLAQEHVDSIHRYALMCQITKIKESKKSQ